MRGKRCSTGANRCQRGRELIAGERGTKEEVQNSCFSLCIVSLSKTPPLCPNSSARTDTTTVGYRWGDGGQEGGREGATRGGRDRGRDVRDGVKITQSYKRLAAGEKCNTAEENR